MNYGFAGGVTSLILLAFIFSPMFASAESSLSVENYGFPIVYESTSNNKPKATLTSNSLVVKLNTINDGTITLNLPENLLQKMQNDKMDNQLFVLIDGEEVRTWQESYPDGIKVEINYPVGSDTIEILDPVTVSEKKPAKPTKPEMTKKDKVAPPLKQVKKDGVKPAMVKCKEGLELILKADNNVPACVKPSTAQKLVERGWAN